MFVLGLGGSGHDFSACLCNENKILGYIEDERITRIKHSFLLGNEEKKKKMSAARCLLNMYGIHCSQLASVVVNDLLSELYYKEYFPDDKITTISHHLAHAASAFYPSSYNEAAILVIDGAGALQATGEYETISFWYGKGNKITRLMTHTGKVVSYGIYRDISMPCTDSIGGFYRAVTHLLGFGLFDEGKTMGLSSYGTDRYWNHFKRWFDVSSDGHFYFGDQSFNELVNLANELKTFQDKADFAYATQKVTNIAVVSAAKAIKRYTDCRRLCMAGGVMLNSVSNYKVYKTNLFSDIFIQPAAGDAGTAIGAAMYYMRQQ